MTKLGPWEQAAMDYEVSLQGSVSSAAATVAGIVLGMAIATSHPEYAQAALPTSQQNFRKDSPDVQPIGDGVENFMQHVPIVVYDEANSGSSS